MLIEGNYDVQEASDDDLREGNDDIPFFPGVDCIGYGYDVINSRYAHTEGVKDRLFEFDKTRVVVFGGKKYKIYSDIDLRTDLDTVIETISSSSIEEYREKIGLNAGVDVGYKVFNGSFKLDIDSQYARLDEVTYTTLRGRHRLWTLALTLDLDVLRKRVTPAFRANFGIDPMEFFGKFGAYYLRRGGVGGRLDYSMSTRHLKVEQGVNISTTVKASLEWLIGINAEVGGSLEKAIKQVRQNSDTKLHSIGGKPGLEAQMLNPETAKGAYAKWAASLKDWAVLMQFDRDSLRPIWELVDDQGYREKLRQSMDKYLASGGAPVEKLKRVLSVEKRPPMLRSVEIGGQVALFSPNVEPGGNSGWVGQLAQYGEISAARTATPVFSDNFDLGLLKPPTSWEILWNGTGYDMEPKLLRAIPPIGYRAVGDKFINGEMSIETNDPYVCVHKSVCDDIEDLGASIARIINSDDRMAQLQKIGSDKDHLSTEVFVGVVGPSGSMPADADVIQELRGRVGRVRLSALIGTEKEDEAPMVEKEDETPVLKP